MRSEASPSAPGLAVSLRLADLCERLRAGGVRCGLDNLLAAHRALVEVEPTRSETRAALSCVLCSSPHDLSVFEEAYEAVFGAPEPEPPAMPLKPDDLEPAAATASPGEEPDRSATMASGGVDPDLAGGSAADEDELHEVSPRRWSATEILREKDFRVFTAEDRVAARVLLRDLAAAMPRRRSSRVRPVHGRGERLDVPRTLRASLRVGGEPFDIRFASRVQAPRRLVFVCDVSGSMAVHATMLLEYVHAAFHAGRSVEAFCFATRIARVTLDLRSRDPERAIAGAESRIPDRSGGTRIGAAIAQLNREHGRRIGRGAVVVILSDGWDRGEPGLLGAEMAHLRRSAHRVLWLDPNMGLPDYEPLTRGMREALPHVERVMPANTLRSIEELAAVLKVSLA
jgi:uncharacterized protein with von Willebrand factor type A (vWA) domain